MDVVDKKTRSRMMSGIRSKNTKPEVLIRKALHSRGFRYRINDRKLPGTPDIVLKKYNAVIFIHGCFWHGHDCSLFRVPSTRKMFWLKKIEKNRKRDVIVQKKLHTLSWRVCNIWECALKGRLQRNNFPALQKKLISWIMSDSVSIEFR